MRLKQYINEKYSFELKKNKTSFYNDPKMLGHHMAKDTIDSIELLLNKVVKDKKQKIITDFLFDFKSDDWHYFNNITKKDVKIYSYILRRINKESPFKLLLWLNKNQSFIKNKLTHIVEYLAYLKDREPYLKYYAKSYGFFGLDYEKAEKMFVNYHIRLEKYDYIKELKKKWK